ncbi:hypothetical protein ACCS54_18955 [Rhizobium johnstonii]|uniref:hypothetical protein n=1 Tax=Rhizobium johnstonii TaxID=3019933 RepID=UPI003F9B1A86
MGIRLGAASVLVLATLLVAAMAGSARAGCGLDPVCAISESAGRGAGKGAADGLRPLVTDVLERQAPALIAQLQTAVDHSILTAEQAGEQLVEYATDLFNKAADDLFDGVKDRSQSLIDYASGQTLTIEAKVFADVQTIIKQLNCQGQAVSAALDRQQRILDDTVNGWIPKIKFWSRTKTEKVEAACRKKLSVDPDLKYSSMQYATTSKLWRCVRIDYIDPNGPAAAIALAYDDVVINDSATMCALQSGNEEPLRKITQIWINDSQYARAWGRAVSGD